MTRRRTILVGLLVTGLLLSLAAWIVLHLERTQHAVWSIVVDTVAEKTCLDLRSDEFSYRLWPARVRISGLVITDQNGGSLSADSFEVQWRWRQIVQKPTHLHSVEVDGLDAPLMNLPSPCGSDQEPPLEDPWSILIIDDVNIRNTSLGAEGGGMNLGIEGLGIKGALAGGTLNVNALAHRIATTRMERTLTIGEIDVSLSADRSGVEINRLTIGSGPLVGEGAGAYRIEPSTRAEGRFALAGDISTLMTWWDPAQTALLKPKGRLNLKGALNWNPEQGIRLGLDHHGAGVEIAAYPVSKAALSIAAETLTATASDATWGRISATLAGGTRIDVEADLDNADPGPAVALAGLTWPSSMPPDVRLSGRAVVGLQLPFSIQRAQGSADLTAIWSRGGADLTGAFAGGVLEFETLDIHHMGLILSAAGAVQPGGRVAVTATAGTDDPTPIFSAIAHAFPDLEMPTLGGGPVRLDCEVTGTTAEPRIAALATWRRPDIAGFRLEAIDATATGTLRDFGWTARVEGPGAAVAEFQGVANEALRISGAWELVVPDLDTAASIFAADSNLVVAGTIVGGGEFDASGGTWTARGQIEATDLQAGPVDADSILLEFAAEPAGLTVPRFNAALLDGSIEGDAHLTLGDEEPTIELHLDWDGLSPSALVDDLPNTAQGTVSGSLEASGPLSSPRGDAWVKWTPTALPSVIEEASITAGLKDGVLRVASDTVRIVSGPLIVSAELPLGAVQRPTWLFPDAPGGAWQIRVDGQRLHLAPVLAAFGHEDIPVDAVADLEASAQWHPGLGGDPQLQLGLLDASVSGSGQKFIAQDPIRLAFDGREFVLGDVVLEGENGHFAIGGSFDATALEVDISAEGRLDPRLARLIPYPVTIRNPMDVSVHVNGPIEALGGTVTIEHPNGAIEIRDPPVQIADLHVEAGIGQGIVDIHEGRARVNEGTVYFGGGWNPAVNQGLVAELEDVLFLLGDGIITKWDGVIAVEPADNKTALVVGELLLDQGLWDSPYDLAGAFLGDDEELASADDLTYTIGLDLDVRGRGGIHVNNNLGRFDLRWNLLEVWGTVAEPHIGGDINILPGGTIKIAGQSIPLRRGLVQFTGDPLVDPVLEIVPEQDIMSSQDGQSSGNLTQMATTGLSAGLGTVLGLDNTTIRPEDIAIETDSDTSTQFSIGQQLTHSTALFLTTDLRNSQNRTSLLQLWRIPTLPGLTVQAMTRTDPGEADLKLLQRFSWGGTRATENQPQLHKVKLEGKWPVSKRKLIKASGLVRDQPWDPFLLFLGRVRIERELAKRGYPEAAVTARAEGPEKRPKAVFTCDIGEKITVEFSGDRLPRKVRRRVVSLYRFPPLADSALENMRTVILRYLWSDGHPSADVETDVDSTGKVKVLVSKGEERRLVGPILEGAPPETQDSLIGLLGSPTELAEIARNPRRAERVVRRVLAAAGYRDTQSVETWTDSIGESTSIGIRVDPGTQSKVEQFKIEGDDPLGLTAAEDFPLQLGMALDRSVIDRTISDLRAAYRAAGYTQAKIRAQMNAMAEAGTWALTLELDVGDTAKVARIDIAGRRHLSDHAVRHGVVLQPGSLFTLEELDETVGRLATFGPIDRIEASTHLEAGDVVVDLDIVEKNRWTVEVGGGWNSDRGVTARTGISDANLFGRGIGATLLGRWERDFLQGRLVLGLPPLPGGRFTAGIIASYTEDVLTPEQEGDILINEHIKEATIEGTYKLSRNLLTRGYYRFSRTRTFEPDPLDPIWALDITTDLGVLGGQLILDRLDNPFDPRSGYYTALDLSWAGEVLGSDTENVRALISSSLAIAPRRDWTWFQSLRIGAAHPINGILDRQSRFFAGGAASVRGFELDSVGPVEVLGGQVIYAGGEALFVLNEELRIPVWKSLRGAVFIDAGQVWESWSDADFALAVGAGIGIRWGTPVGPLWADVAWPVANRGLNSGARFSFGIGRTF